MQACVNCGVSLAEDQRYCLECGARQVHARSQFLDRFTPAGALAPAHPGGAQMAGGSGGSRGGWRSPSTTAVAGVGVLLLAMGVGVLIGRAGREKGPATTPAQVISVNTPGASGNPTATTPGESSPGGTTHGLESNPGNQSGGGVGSSPSSAKKSSSPQSSSKTSSGGSSKSGAAKSKAPTSPPSKAPNSGQNAEKKSLNLPNVVTTG